MADGIYRFSGAVYHKFDDFSAVKEIIAAAGSRVKIEAIGTWPGVDFSIMVENGGELELIVIDIDTVDTRFNTTVELADNASFDFRLGSLSEEQSAKLYEINVNQKGRNSRSTVSMLGVATDYARLTFTGFTRINKGAVKSSARQEGRIASLSEHVKASCSPALLIDENDVTASHGAALGQIDENQLFYLMSRGLTRQEAETIITLGYLTPVIGRLESAEDRSRLSAAIESKVIKDD